VKELDAILTKLGITDSAERAAVAVQIQLLALEDAIGNLAQQGSLSEADALAVKRIAETKTADAAAIQQLFGSPERQLVLNASMTAALKVATGH
jgi:hypothetical protein